MRFVGTNLCGKTEEAFYSWFGHVDCVVQRIYCFLYFLDELSVVQRTTPHRSRKLAVKRVIREIRAVVLHSEDN